MGRLSGLAPRNWQHTTGGGRRAVGAGASGAPAATIAAGANGHTVELPLVAAASELLERRRELAERLAEIQWDLGGLTYEMAIRDHFVLETLVRRAAELQEVDAQLAEVERLLRMEDAGAAGECSNCGALHSRGAVFCWQCGQQLLATSTA